MILPSFLYLFLYVALLLPCLGSALVVRLLIFEDRYSESPQVGIAAMEDGVVMGSENLGPENFHRPSPTPPLFFMNEATTTLPTNQPSRPV